MLKHIGLQIIESDVYDFYVHVLGGRVQHKFVLNEETSKEVFHLSQEADVYELSAENVDFELFVREGDLSGTYHHICMVTSNADHISERAFENQYSVHARKNRSGRHTYFIRDKAGNLIELKGV